MVSFKFRVSDTITHTQHIFISILVKTILRFGLSFYARIKLSLICILKRVMQIKSTNLISKLSQLIILYLSYRYYMVYDFGPYRYHIKDISKKINI